MSRSQCELCDAVGIFETDISMALVEWAEPIDGMRFSAVIRCRDRAACRRRLEEAGEAWPVVDALMVSVGLGTEALIAAPAVAVAEPSRPPAGTTAPEFPPDDWDPNIEEDDRWP